MPPPLCLLLLLLLLSAAAAAAALPTEGALAGHDGDRGHMQAVAGMKENGLRTFLAWWYAWASRARAAPLAFTFPGGAAGGVSRRQEGPPPPQAARPEKVPCKNFFWKTFSSCR